VLDDRVLVTNLDNRVQPLIRYELHDRMTVVADDGLLRVRVQGRSDDVLRWDDIEVHPLVIRAVLVRTPEVLDYQVRQTAGGVDLDVLADDRVEVGDLRDRVAEALAEAGLPGPVVAVRAVAQLARHPETGKLARFVALR
jgi:phenylacetate-CoA ligase